MTKQSPTNNKKKMNLIIILSSVGALLIFAVTGLLAYLPGKLSTTSYDFLYTGSYDAYGKYIVDNDKIRIEPYSKYEPPRLDDSLPVIYRYDVTTNTSSVVTDDEVVNIKVDGSDKSPDGYVVSMKYTNSSAIPRPFPMGNDVNYNASVFLSKGISNRNISVEQNDFGSFQFVAWVIED